MKEKKYIQENPLTPYLRESLIVYLNNVLRMGRIVQGMFYKFSDAYFQKEIPLSEEIISQDDRVDYLEAKLDYEGRVLLSKANFSGIYLKANLLGLKLVYIFENMADLCESNAKLNIELMKYPPKINVLSFEDLFKQTQEAFSSSLRVFSDFININLITLKNEEFSSVFFNPCQNICTLNNEASSLFHAYKKYLYKSKESIESISLHMDILSNIEHFSDMSTNIAENIVFAITGNKYRCRKNSLDLFFSVEEEE